MDDKNHLIRVESISGRIDWWNPETGEHVSSQDPDSDETATDRQYHDFDREPWLATDTESTYRADPVFWGNIARDYLDSIGHGREANLNEDSDVSE